MNSHDFDESSLRQYIKGIDQMFIISEVVYNLIELETLSLQV